MKKIIILMIALVTGIILPCFSGCESGDKNSVTEDKNTDISSNETESASSNSQTEPEEDRFLYITIGETTLTAELGNNSSADALIELLSDGDVTIDMSDYGNFEKVGDLGKTLPTNDEQITTEAGDLILYQGNNFVIYYDTNSWSFTKLGKIKDCSQEELKEILGNGDVTVTLSITNEG